MAFKTLRIYVSLIFTFIILSDAVFGGRLAELQEEAKGIMGRRQVLGRLQFQRDFEGFLLRLLESTGYNITGTEIYLDKTFIQRLIEEQRHRLILLEEEKSYLRTMECQDEDASSVQTQALNLHYKKCLLENELARRTTQLHLERLQGRYDLLWETTSGPEAHKSELLPRSLERKSGWTSYYFVDASNMLFIVDPTDHSRTELMFNTIFSMFAHLDSQCRAARQAFPEAMTPALRTRFALYKPRDYVSTMRSWGREFIEREANVFSTTLKPLDTELRAIQFSLEHPHAEGLDVEEIYERIGRSGTVFRDLREKIATLLLKSSLPVATETERDDEGDELNQQLQRVREELLSLQPQIEESEQRFGQDKLFIEYTPLTNIHEYFRTLEESLRMFQERYESFSLTIRRIDERIAEREQETQRQLDQAMEEIESKLKEMPVLEEQVIEMEQRVKEAEQAEDASSMELMYAQRDARLSDTNLFTERFYHHVSRAMSTSLEQLLSAFEALSGSALETLVQSTLSSDTLSEQEARALTDQLDSLESFVATLNGQLEEAVSKFHRTFEQVSASVQPLTPAESVPFEESISLRVTSMHTVNGAIRHLFNTLHVIISEDTSTSALPEDFASSIGGRAMDVSATELESRSSLRRLLDEFDFLSTSTGTITHFIETRTRLLLHKVETLLFNKSKRPSNIESSPGASKTITVRA